MKMQSWPASLDSIPRIRGLIKAEATRVGFDSKSAVQLGLAVEEITANIITYAYQNDSEKTIEIAVENNDSGLTIHVCDQGPPFDPLTVPAPDIDAPVTDREIGGLGILMVKAMVDEMNYERREGKNHVVLVKKMPDQY
jgi:anti-sigma regulatory factor (Ser/Thr protein kinase)